MFDEAYFKSDNYVRYLERGPRYRRTAAELADVLLKLGLLHPNSRIIDYGCAVGLLMEWFVEDGYLIHGVDVSEWARAEAVRRGLIGVYPSAVEAVGNVVDVLLALDVFEHMDDAAVREVFAVCDPSCFVVRIPSSTDGETFHLAESRADPTHINCKTKEEWEGFFLALGYTTLRLNLFTVYDTPGVTCLLGVRQ